jgi:hypothetical protein
MQSNPNDDGLQWEPVTPAQVDDGLQWEPVDPNNQKGQGFVARVAGSLVGAIPFFNTEDAAQSTVDVLDPAIRGNVAQMGPIFAGNLKRMAAETTDPIVSAMGGGLSAPA